MQSGILIIINVSTIRDLLFEIEEKESYFSARDYLLTIASRYIWKNKIQAPILTTTVPDTDEARARIKELDYFNDLLEESFRGICFLDSIVESIVLDGLLSRNIFSLSVMMK